MIQRLKNGSTILCALGSWWWILSLSLLVSSGSAAVGLDSRGSGDFPQSRAPSPEAFQADVRELAPATPIERELAGAEVHAYQITLTSGQYLRVIVDQHGIDVVVTLFGPDGQKLAEMDCLNATQGQEPISIVGEASGTYRLEVRATQKTAATGRYEINAEWPRPATAQDKEHVVAQRAFLEGEQLRAEGMAESLRRAIEKYKEALALWQVIGDRWAIAITLNSIGLVHRLLSEYQQSLDFYNQALPLFRSLGDRVGEAMTLYRIGSAYFWLDQFQKALDYFNQALPLRRVVGDRRGEAETLNSIGITFASLNEFDKALESYKQALYLWRILGDRAGEAGTLDNLGAFYYWSDLKRALECYTQALSIYRDLGNRRMQAEVSQGIAAIYKAFGETQKALDLTKQVLKLRREVGDRRGEAFTLTHIGEIYQSELGDEEKAIEHFEQGLAIWRELGSRVQEAITLGRLGQSYQNLGKYNQALDYFNQALSHIRTMGVYEEAVALLRIGYVERDRGNLAEARSKIEAALTFFDSFRAKFANPAWRPMYSDMMQKRYEVYIDVLMCLHKQHSSDGFATLALEASERARSRSLLEILTEARADIRSGVDSALLERERTLQQQINAKAERLTQLLSGKHTEEQSEAAKKELEALLTEYQEVEGQIRAKSPRYAALTQPQPLSLKKIQEQALDEDTLLLEYALGEERSSLWAVTKTSIASFELPKRAEIEAAARRVYDLLVKQAHAQYPDALATLSQMLLGPVAEQLDLPARNAQVGKKRLVIVADGALQYVPFAALPAPVNDERGVMNDELSSSSRSLLSIHRSSFQTPLIVDHEIISLPSASVLAVLRRELAGRKPAARTVAVLADPVFDKDDERVKLGVRGSALGVREKPSAPNPNPESRTPSPQHRTPSPEPLTPDLERSAKDFNLTRFDRLPATRREAEAIMNFVPKGEGLKALDFQASKPVATSVDLSQHRIVHFATHGLLNSQHPELSGVVLSLVDEQGRPQDGFLRLHEIYNLNLPAELVVLSGCKTGLGKEIKGEGLIGLTRGFMYAGAPRVLVSLWDVSDIATAELMKRFYKGMLKDGLRPVAALRAAQISMLKQQRWSAPYYWAGFILQGEWR